MSASFRRHAAAWAAPFVAVFGLALLVGACGGDDDAASTTPGSVVVGEPDAARGEGLAEDSGCMACHRPDGGGVGPTWVGLYGSTVTLDDATTVVADEAYLTRAIADPGADKVDGYAIAMPTDNGLGDAEIADIVAYIRSLSDDASTAPTGASTP